MIEPENPMHPLNPGQFPSSMYGTKFAAGSAYGTDHPADIALGKSRQVKSYADAASSGVSSSDTLHEASAINQSASDSGTSVPPPTTIVQQAPMGTSTGNEEEGGAKF